MRNLFYSSLFILLFAASLLVITIFLRSRNLNVTIIEPVHTEQTEQKKEKTPPPQETSVPQTSVNAAAVEKAVKTPESKPLPQKEKAVTVRVIVPEEKETAVMPAEKIETEPQQPQTKPAAPKISVKKNTENTENIEHTESKSAAKQQETVIVPEYECKWIEDFEPDGHVNGVKYADNWKREGGVIFTPKTRFYLKKDPQARANTVLVIESRRSSAVFACDLSEVIDLNKTPILRWRWRVKKLPPRGDGRHKKRDDQAVGIYIGTGTAFNQKAISYRWETETPLGHWGKTVYSNVMNVWFYCLRNKHNGLNVWYEESRDVRQDFLDKYGFVPKKIALVICGNSQNSKSEALAEIDHIGFYKEVKRKGKK